VRGRKEKWWKSLSQGSARRARKEVSLQAAVLEKEDLNIGERGRRDEEKQQRSSGR